MCRYVSSAESHCTAAKTMKCLRDPLLEEGQLFHSCARNISGRGRFCICTLNCTQRPIQEVELQVPAVNMVLLLVEERGHHPQGADGRRQCRTGELALSGTCTWKFLEPLSPQWDHLPLERHGSFTELGLGGSGKMRVKGHK